ncbi:MAG: hypothetical protein HN855_16940 [Anaerolineae bacterium]|jgi:hypothetical protein|nr:hypothetical protein [Anaerolineae bacterium]MBT7069376.1 hypothetical protein [Anaerolineae bacterium]MBT7326836.1 hypothetical protein [Anaerolineae bacterium]
MKTKLWLRQFTDFLIGSTAGFLFSVIFSLVYLIGFTTLTGHLWQTENNFAVGMTVVFGMMLPASVFLISGTITGSVISVFQNYLKVRKRLLVVSLLIWGINELYIFSLYFPLRSETEPLVFLFFLSAITLLEILSISVLINWLMKQIRKPKARATKFSQK